MTDTQPPKAIKMIFKQADVGPRNLEFVEVHDDEGKSIDVGTWAANGDYEQLTITADDIASSGPNHREAATAPGSFHNLNGGRFKGQPPMTAEQEVAYVASTLQPSKKPQWPCPATMTVPDALHDFTTHRASWRSAILGMIGIAPLPNDEQDDRGYWEHELRAFDSAMAMFDQHFAAVKS